MPEKAITMGEEKMAKAIEALKKELALVRTGRANPSVLNNVSVVYYGSLTPLSQISSISVPEAQQLVIKPYDKGSLKDIETAIQLADLNLVPQNDGVVIRINFPMLTEQRRKELVKEVKVLAENAKVAIRNIRREVNDQLKKMEKDKEISEDDLKYFNEQTQKSTDKYIENVDLVTKDKEKQIMEI